jgi:hypothetical protein
MSGEIAICISWQSPVMPVAAHNYYHQRCYTGSSFPRQEKRELAIKDVGMNAVCCGCGEPIRKDAGNADVTNEVA